MTGFGSPCGACKFLRRKCVRGCVFAPYFCHDQGATHFAAIHKVFGASNVSKLLAHLPVTDRSEAAVTISYEAQARLQDPIYGCVSHIFALQQQVVSLQAQLASLKAEVTQGTINSSNTTARPKEEKFHGNFPSYPQDFQAVFQFQDSKATENFHQHPVDDNLNMLYHENGFMDLSTMASYYHSVIPNEDTQFPGFEDSSNALSSLDMQTNTRKWAFQNSEDLQSVPFAPFAYMQHS
ncbi:hypothetical protein GIB67_039577 [Kingdonia uniflora]|uniref:LOB domain-containing protein n=1 Tax=Kingdonia uniflora TaxID=39325 RepID=A0A7J7P6G1_9MAGN|nr:hypothetical protein GIB67_039577 [Kingdonia uniflora]